MASRPAPLTFGAWLGKTETPGDDFMSYPPAALAATLDRAVPGDVVPLLWNGLYFLPVEPRMDAVPPLGQHTDAILAALGCAPARIDALRANVTI